MNIYYFRCKQFLLATQVADFRRRYKYLQLIHCEFTAIFHTFTSTQLVLAEGTAIVALFCAIGLINQANAGIIVLMFFVGIVVLILLQIILYLFGEVFEISNKYPRSYLKSGSKLTKWEVGYYKSCKPFGFQIGGFSMVKKMTYLNVLSDIILAKVCDLIITFK